MGMAARGWAVLRQALTAVRRRPKLLAFPLVAGAPMVVLAASLALGALLVGWLMFYDGGGLGVLGWWWLPLWVGMGCGYFLLYVATALATTFCRVAFVRGCWRGLDDEPVSVRQGFDEAWSRGGPVMAWSLFSVVAGWGSRVAPESGSAGVWAMRMVGGVWSVAAVFAMAVLAGDDVPDDPVAVLQRSADAVKTVWGETFLGFLGYKLLVLTGILPALLLTAVLAIRGGAFDDAWGGVLLALIGVAVLLGGVCIYAGGVVKTLYLAALYRYANGGATPAFADLDLSVAFKTKKK